jgi:beta-lactam-binding protein with PASTA domain
VVPNVVHRTLAQARTRIVRAHCRVGHVTRRFSTAHLRNRVLAQSPRAGRRLPNGTRVNLTVGKGPKKR